MVKYTRHFKTTDTPTTNHALLQTRQLGPSPRTGPVRTRLRGSISWFRSGVSRQVRERVRFVSDCRVPFLVPIRGVLLGHHTGMSEGTSLRGPRAAEEATAEMISLKASWWWILSPLPPHDTWWSPKMSPGVEHTRHAESSEYRGTPNQYLRLSRNSISGSC